MKIKKINNIPPKDQDSSDRCPICGNELSFGFSSDFDIGGNCTECIPIAICYNCKGDGEKKWTS